MQKVFICLTKINDNRAVRNRASVKEIKQLIGEESISNKQIEGLINLFRLPANTLMRPFISGDATSSALQDTDVLDITHESLIRNWTELTELTKKDHENVLVLNDFRKQLDRWEYKKRSKDFLLTIGSLSYFKSWFEQLKPNAYRIQKYDERNIPAEKKLEESSAFLQTALEYLGASERSIKGKRRLAVILTTAVVLVLLSFTGWAFSERNKAMDQEHVAVSKTREAMRSKEEAMGAKTVAEKSKEQALKNETLALAAEEKARVAMVQAEQSSDEAKANFQKAEKNARLAKNAAKQANAALAESEKAKNEAIQSKNSAIKAETKSAQLSNLSLAQNIALKSGLRSDDPELQGLLAYQAFKYTKGNGGATQDPIIYEAVRNAYLNNKNPKNEVKMLTDGEQKATKLSADSKTVLSADKKGNVYKWDVVTGKVLGRGSLHNANSIDIIQFLDWPNVLCCGYTNGTIAFWDLTALDKPALIKEFAAHRAAPRAIVSDADKGLIVTCGKDSCLCVWNYKNGVIGLQKKITVGGPVRDMVLLPEGDELIVLLDNGALSELTISSEKSKPLPNTEKSRARVLSLSNTKNILAVGYQDGKIQLFDTHKISANANVLYVYSENRSVIENIVFSSDDKLLAASSSDKYVKVFDLSNKGQRAIQITNLKSKTRSLLFDKDNKLYACGSDHKIIRIETSCTKMADEFPGFLKRNMSELEWIQNVGSDVPYQKTIETLK